MHTGHRALGDSEVPLTVCSESPWKDACSMSNWLGGARPSTENPCAGGFYWDCSQKNTRPCDACSSLYRSRWYWPGTGCLAKRPAEGKQQARFERISTKPDGLPLRNGRRQRRGFGLKKQPPDLSSRMGVCFGGVGRRRGASVSESNPRSQLENGGLFLGLPRGWKIFSMDKDTSIIWTRTQILQTMLATERTQ